MAVEKKKKNYLRIEDPKLNKVFWWVASAILAIACVTLTIIIVELISLSLSGYGQDVASLFPGLEPLVERFFVVFLILFIAFLTIVIYVYATNRENDKINKKKIEVDSPLLGAAKEHQEQIIDLLMSVAKPTSGKQYLNRAPTVQFLRALTELGYMDANTSGPNMMAWVEMATGYKDKDKDSGHFFSAYNNTSNQDTKVLGFMEQIEKIVGK